MTTYSATYYTSPGQYYPATIFISSVTITIRYIDEDNQQQDINWLIKEVRLHNENEVHHGQQKLVIKDESAKQVLKSKFRKSNIAAKLVLIAGIIIGLFLAAYLWLFPWMGERVAMNFNKETEINMGEQMYKSIAATYKIDSHKTTIINQFYQQLHYNVDYPIKITVVQSPEMNAFAVPGGHIVVYDALMERMKTPEELAALLAHESSHVALRHSLRNIFRSLARKMFLALLLGNDAGITSVVVGNADELKGLQYSRSLETEADDNGIALMSKNHVNQQGMLRLMQLLQKESEGPQTPEILNTHPVFKNRITNIEEQLKKHPNTPGSNPQLRNLFHEIYE